MSNCFTSAKPCSATRTANTRCKVIADAPLPSSLSGACILPQGQVLKQWVHKHGGHVHPCLELVENPPSHANRGIVATQDIPFKHLMGGQLGEWPLMCVPQKLAMTSKQAKQLICTRLDRVGQRLDDCPASMNPYLLAVLVAVERRKGRQSFWHPYIDALPEDPPGARFMSEERIKYLLRGLVALASRQRNAGRTLKDGPLGVEWFNEVVEARHHALLEMQELQELLGKAFPELTLEELYWAYGQVESRAFVQDSDGELGMEPMVDLCNHRQGAAQPGWDCLGKEGDRQQDTEEEAQEWSLLHAMDNGQLIDLKAGDELFVSYSAEQYAPLQSFLTWGFVPPELIYKQLNAPSQPANDASSSLWFV